MRIRVVAAGLFVLAQACKSDPPHDAPHAAQASPQASAEPAPLAMPLALGNAGSPEGGPPPAPMRGDVAISAENPAKDLAGYTVTVVLRLPDAPAVPGGSPINGPAIDGMRKQNEPRFTIDLSPARMRMRIG